MMYQLSGHQYKKGVLIKHKGIPMHINGKLITPHSIVWWWPINWFVMIHGLLKILYKKTPKSVIILTATALGAFIYRLRGSDWNLLDYIPHPLVFVLFCTPFFYIAFKNYKWYWALLASVCTLLFCLTGHGNFFYDTSGLGDPERIELLISWLQDSVSHEIYATLGWMIKGLGMTLPYISLSRFVGLSGLFMPVAYYASHIDGFNTEGAEWIIGGALWCACANFIMKGK